MHITPIAIVVALLVLRCTAACLADDLDHPHGFDASAYPNRVAWEQRSEFLPHQVLVAQDLWPMPQKTPLNPIVHGKIDRGDYTVEKVFFASMPGHYVSGNLYRPKIDGWRRLPAVLMPHGHWPDGRFFWRSDADAK